MDKDVEKVGQNSVSFDAPLIDNEFGIVMNNHCFDTMNAFHLLYPELPKSLNFLCSILTDYPNYWSDKVTENDVSEWTYNCWDAIVTLDAAYKIEDELNKTGMLDLYKTHTHPCSQVLAKMSWAGILIDVDKREEIKIVTNETAMNKEIPETILIDENISRKYPLMILIVMIAILIILIVYYIDLGRWKNETKNIR